MIPGTRFGKLRVVKRAKPTTKGNAQVLCCCECGTETITRRSWLTSGKVTACRACTAAAAKNQ